MSILKKATLKAVSAAAVLTLAISSMGTITLNAGAVSALDLIKYGEKTSSSETELSASDIIYEASQNVQASGDSADVSADTETASDKISTSDNPIVFDCPDPNAASPVQYTKEEYDMLCAVVMREAGGCSLKTKQIVASIAINRVRSAQFPNTIKEVLSQPNQFNSISNYYTNERPADSATKFVVLYVLKSGLDFSNGAVFYYAPKYMTNQSTVDWFESKNFLFEFEGQRFFN